MLVNPFTPSDIASQPDDFFGRATELNNLERAINQGSVAILGPIGIGKSSLMAKARLFLEGFESRHKSKSFLSVGDRDTKTLDDAARLILESFVEIVEKKNSIKLKIPKFAEFEDSEIVRYFQEKRHLATLKRIIENDHVKNSISETEYLIIAIDEVDKCPQPIAQIVRALLTHSQQQNINNLRFVLAGVNPYFEKMIEEDSGIERFFYSALPLGNFTENEAIELIDTKFSKVLAEAKKLKIDLDYDESIINRIVQLSGGHPHILQLLGSHVIESENDDPDGIIDLRDLINSLNDICYNRRANIYRNTLHLLASEGKIEILSKLVLNMNPGCPARIERKKALELVEPSDIQWLVEHDILSVLEKDYYGFIDEFLRIRMIFDELESEEDRITLEQDIIEDNSIINQLGDLMDEDTINNNSN